MYLIDSDGDDMLYMRRRHSAWTVIYVFCLLYFVIIRGVLVNSQRVITWISLCFTVYLSVSRGQYILWFLSITILYVPFVSVLCLSPCFTFPPQQQQCNISPMK